MEIEVHNIFSRTPNLQSLVCSWQSHVSAAHQKPGVVVLSLISPGCTSELWAVECQRNYPNCQGVPWLQAGQALGLPLHPGFISCMTLSLFPHLVTGSSLHSGSQNSGDGGMWWRKGAFLSISQYGEMPGQGVWEESSAAQLLSSPDEPFLVNLPPFTQNFLLLQSHGL